VEAAELDLSIMAKIIEKGGIASAVHGPTPKNILSLNVA